MTSNQPTAGEGTAFPEFCNHCGLVLRENRIIIPDHGIYHQGCAAAIRLWTQTSPPSPTEPDGQWQTMDTAPTDGTLVEGKWGNRRIAQTAFLRGTWTIGNEAYFAPDYWRPLPSPQTGSGSGSGTGDLHDKAFRTIFPHGTATHAEETIHAKGMEVIRFLERELEAMTRDRDNWKLGTDYVAHQVHALIKQRDEATTALAATKQALEAKDAEVKALTNRLRERMRQHGALRMAICEATGQEYITDETAIAGVRTLTTALSSARAENEHLCRELAFEIETRDRNAKLCEEARAELEGLVSEKKAVVEMLNQTALAAGFDGYDESTELWRNVQSFHNRMWDYWKAKHDEIAGGAEVTQRIATLEADKARIQAKYIEASAALEMAQARVKELEAR